jgi:acyl-coenzyme A thioesterase PaaI-like protein
VGIAQLPKCFVRDLPPEGSFCPKTLDTAGWFTVATAHDVDCWLATAEMSIHVLAAVQQSPLRAVGRLIKQGKRQYVGEMHLYDGQGLLVGHATGTFIVLPNVPLR